MKVEKLATLLNTTPDVVEKAIEEDGIDGLIEQFQSSHEIFTKDELTKKLENHVREEINKLGTDGKPLPSNIYNFAKGNAFEKLEKEWAKQFGVEEWSGIDDLRDKIIEKEKGKSADEDVQTYVAEIEKLKKLVLEAENEKKTAVAEAEKKFHNSLIARDIDAATSSIGIDADGERLENQKKILRTMFMTNYDFEYRDGQTVVLKDGNPVTNKVGDPVSINDVLKEFAPQWVDVKDVPKGGRGGSSAGTGEKGIKAIKTAEDFWAYLEKEGIQEGSEKMLEVLSEVKAANPALKI